MQAPPSDATKPLSYCNEYVKLFVFPTGVLIMVACYHSIVCCACSYQTRTRRVCVTTKDHCKRVICTVKYLLITSTSSYLRRFSILVWVLQSPNKLTNASRMTYILCKNSTLYIRAETLYSCWYRSNDTNDIWRPKIPRSHFRISCFVVFVTLLVGRVTTATQVYKFDFVHPHRAAIFTFLHPSIVRVLCPSWIAGINHNEHWNGTKTTSL